MEDLQKVIGSDGFRRAYRQREQDFWRHRVLSFVGLVVSQINLMSRSLSVEVSRFVERFLGPGLDYSKQAFSQCRRKLQAEAFTALRQRLVAGFYADGEYRKWQGYLLLALDATALQLPESPDLAATFGLAENKGKTMPMVRASLLYDVENELVVDALLEDYRTGEREMAHQHINCLSRLAVAGPCLLLLDRGYPSLWLIAQLQGGRVQSQQLEFVMRCSEHFLPEVSAFAQQPAREALLELDLRRGSRLRSDKLRPFLFPGQTSLQVRCVKVALPGGKTEYLLTSLRDMEVSCLGRLYHKRWGVEAGIDFAKNALQLENFSARTVLGVRQDFEAHMLAVNLSALLVADAQQQVEAEQAPKHNKHRYKVNRAVALGLVKDNLAALLLGKEPLEQLYDRLLEKIKKRKEALKPGRSYPRTRKLHYKFNSNKRSVL